MTFGRDVHFNQIFVFKLCILNYTILIFKLQEVNKEIHKEYYKLVACQMFYDWSSKGSTYSAVVPLTNLFGLYQIPEPEPGQLMIPNYSSLPMMSDVRYEIKTPLPVIWLETIDTKNPGWSVRNELTNWSWLIWLKMKRFVHGLILQASDNAI